MSRLEIISTSNVSPRRKLRFWNETISAALATAIADPIDEAGFEGELGLLDVGGVRLAEIHGGASTVRRLPGRDQDPLFVLQLVLAGELEFCIGANRTRMRTGDICLFDSSRAAELLLPRPASLLSIGIHRDRLLPYIGCPEAAAFVGITAATAGGALLERYLRDLWSQAKQGLPEALLARFLDIALRMTAGIFAELPDARPAGSMRAQQLRSQVLTYVEKHLSDPTLSPRTIAAEFDLTPGYLHRLFVHDSDSLARYVLRRRLEECHHVLSDGMHAGRSITAIAYAQGFNNAAHFSRVFRSRYGMTPRELRERRASLRHRPGARPASPSLSAPPKRKRPAR